MIKKLFVLCLIFSLTTACAPDFITAFFTETTTNDDMIYSSVKVSETTGIGFGFLLNDRPKEQPREIRVNIFQVFKIFRSDDIVTQMLYRDKILVFDAQMVSYLRGRGKIKVNDDCFIYVNFPRRTLLGIDLSKTYRIKATLDDFVQFDVRNACELNLKGLKIKFK